MNSIDTTKRWINFTNLHLKKLNNFIKYVPSKIVKYIFLDKNLETIQKMVDYSPKSKQYYSD